MYLSFPSSLRLCHDWKDALVTLSLIGFTTYDVVYFMAITNYVVQCEMVFYFVRSVRELIKQKQYPNMDAAVKASTCVHLHFSQFCFPFSCFPNSYLLSLYSIFVHPFRIYITSVKNCVNWMERHQQLQPLLLLMWLLMQYSVKVILFTTIFLSWHLNNKVETRDKVDTHAI